MFFFPRILESLPPLPRQTSAAAIGCTKIYQPIGVTVHNALTALKISYSDVGEGGVALNCKKNTIFPEHPVHCWQKPEVKLGKI